jgi:hypothetical protein
MNREWLGRTAVRLYPASVRADRGAELVGTLLDAGDASSVTFVRQLCSVIAAGFGARLREAMTESTAQLVINTVVWVAVFATMVILAARVAIDIQLHANETVSGGPLVPIALPALVLVLFTFRRTRASGLVGLGWIVLSIVEYVDFRPPSPVFLTLLRVFVVWYALPLAGFAALALVPQRVATRGRWLWLVPAAIIASVDATAGSQAGVSYIAPVLVGVCLLPFKPSFALGAALAWVPFGVWDLTGPGGAGRWTAVSVELLILAAFAVIVVVIGRRLADRARPQATPLG